MIVIIISFNISIYYRYRVARIEQTETPEMLKERNKTASRGQSGKVVAREMCSIMSRGTRTYGHLDDITALEDDSFTMSASSVLLSLKEVPVPPEASQCNTEVVTNSRDRMVDGDMAVVEYGICLVDTILGNVTLGQFYDNTQRTRLRTMIARYLPTEVTLEYNNASNETNGVLRLLIPQAAKEILKGDEIPVPQDTIARIYEEKYFYRNDRQEIPSALNQIINKCNQQSTSPVLSALGGALWLLKRSLIDYEIFSLGRFALYIPADEYANNSTSNDTVLGNVSTNVDADVESNKLMNKQLDTVETNINKNIPPSASKYLVLDSIALSNLEILVSSYDGTEKGSLWAFLNRCKTSFGKRLLRHWLCNPLYDVKTIAQR